VIGRGGSACSRLALACGGGLTLGLAIAAACANAPLGDQCAPWRRPKAIDPDCLAIPEVDAYLKGLQQRVHATFRLPEGFDRDGHVQVRFALDASGALASRCIARSSDRELARATLEALDRAAPFAPAPRYAACVVGAEISRDVYTLRRDAP
jgi:TonB family protein